MDTKLEPFDGEGDDPRTFPAPPTDPAAVPEWLAAMRIDMIRWERQQRRGRRITWYVLPLYLAAVLALVYEIGNLSHPDDYFAGGALFGVLSYQWFLPYIVGWNHSSSISGREPPEAGSVS